VALACQGFPSCNGSSWPAWEPGHAFQWLRGPGEDSNGNPLPLSGLIAIHWLHRLGAAVVSALVLLLVSLGVRAQPRAGLRLLVLLFAWLLQAGLGIANVLLLLPLPVAVAHNAGALLLLSVAVLTACGFQAESRALRLVPSSPVAMRGGKAS